MDETTDKTVLIKTLICPCFRLRVAMVLPNVCHCLKCALDRQGVGAVTRSIFTYSGVAYRGTRNFRNAQTTFTRSRTQRHQTTIHIRLPLSTALAMHIPSLIFAASMGMRLAYADFLVITEAPIPTPTFTDTAAVRYTTSQRSHLQTANIFPCRRLSGPLP